jgi:eukaryotic-like serine/threonine-protein kinase
MIGRVIGRYRIVEKLGEGGMGSVWRAEDSLLGRAVALKLMREGASGNPTARRRFLREARVASTLDHPGIATVFDAGEHDGGLFLAVACVDGDTLRQRIAAGPMAIAEAVRIAIDVADALGHAHARDVAHRDVTAANIMVTRAGRAVLIDFGLAAIRDASALTSSDAALGTVGYMAPEVVQGRTADARSDVYGLGVVLYEMLTGVRPFVAERPEAVLYEVVNGTLVPPRQVRPKIPRALDQVVTKALARAPGERYDNGAALAAALRAVRLAHAARVAERPATPAAFPARGPRARCLLMLPFEDVSSTAHAAAQAQLFAHGLAGALSAALAGIPGLEVIPPGGPPLAPNEDPHRRARELGADLVLRGSVTRSHDHLRVSYIVTSRIGGTQLGGERVDGTMQELIALEDRLVESVRRALALESVPAPPAAARPAGDPAAREHYLQALGYLQHRENEASVDGAIGILEKLGASEPEPAVVLAALGRAYLAKHRLTARREWADRAADVCERALALAPDAPEVMLTLGTLRGTTGHHSQAVRALRRALRLRPEQAEAWVALSHSWDALGRTREAEQACRRAIALRPSWWSTWAWLGYLQFAHGRYAEAVASFRRVVELTPDSPRGYSNLGGTYFQMGEYDAAQQAYRRSLEAQPTSRAYSGLGTVQFMLADYDAAAVSFESATCLLPAEPENWGNLADAHRWRPGHEQEAVEAYDRAISLARERLLLDSSDARAWARLGEWLAKRGDPREARRVIARALKASPDNANIATIAGLVYTLLGEHDEALACFARALNGGLGVERLERDPELVPLHDHPEFRRLVTEWRAKPMGTDADETRQGGAA